MHFLLIHSPLVPRETWLTLVLSLEAVGCQASVVALDNNVARDSRLYERHIAQIETALARLSEEKIIAVAHSGAGNLLALLDPGRFEGHVFLDAIFPIEKASRFDLFDDPTAVKGWQEVAYQSTGMLPASMIARFGEQIENRDAREAFLAEIVDVPVELYEEQIPVHPNWPCSKRGLYVQWTVSYSADAARADKAGFEVRRDMASHFKMLNQSDDVARELARFALEIE